MSPFTLLGWLLIIVVVTMCVAYFRPRRKPEAVYGTDDGQADVYRETSIGRNARTTFEKIKREERAIGRHPGLDAPYGKRAVPPNAKKIVAITPRQMESVNIKRKLRGYPPLNRKGVQNAISSAWDTPRREPATSNDWLTYLILYEVFTDDHKSHTCAGTGGFTIDPNQPYNGQGGEFAGAGASGSWTDAPPDVSSAAALISTGSHFADNLSEPASFKGSSDNDPKYSPGDTVSGYGSGSRSDDPAPTQAPDPTPSSAPSVSDSGSSYSSSSDSSSSSSSSSDSGSSGGGDSGGGGGGGGGD